MDKKVLIGSPIKQKPQILQEFLNGLAQLKQKNIQLHYYFFDDNEFEESSDLLLKFAENGRTTIEKVPVLENSYFCNDTTHYWKEHLIWRIAAFKNQMIQRAVEENFDYLLLVDSDLVLHPLTIQQLMRDEKDIISEIFWTSWQPGTRELPNVWLYDLYDMALRQRGEKLSQQELDARGLEFVARLHEPGVYEVGGLGACTLLSRKALCGGISFSEIKNLTMWGEDRHFCVRACALGFSLYVDTNCPAYHIYRESLLAGVQAYQAGIDTEPLSVSESTHN